MNSLQNKRIAFFIAMLLVGAGSILLYLVLTGNTAQKYTDVVMEYTSILASNKSAERNLFYIFSISGVFIYTLFYFISQWKNKSIVFPTEKNTLKYTIPIVSLLIFTSIYYFVYQSINQILLVSLIVGAVAFCHDRASVLPSVAFVFINIYALCGIYRIYVFAGGTVALSLTTLALISLLFTLFLFALNHKFSDIFERAILVCQLFIPFTLLMYLTSKYLCNGDFVYISVPLTSKIFILLLLVIFLVEAFTQLIKQWGLQNIELKNIISFGMCVSIMSFNRFSGTGAIIPEDLHHPYENIIGFSQIFELGQKAFDEYIPISGMYSVIHGFFLYLFGQDQMAYYYLVQNIFYLVIILITVFLLKKLLKPEWLLYVALVVKILDYNRIAFILPIMLLLASPKLIENKNRWLKVWYLSSFLHALYYPVFGAAVCIGFLPLGIWQIYTYAKSGKLISDIKTINFWFWWIVCSIPVGLGFPCLIGTAKHTLAMSDQTIYSDGITRFGQTITDNFLTYINSLSLRLVIYYLFSFLLVISLVWLSVAISLKLGAFHFEAHKLKADNPIAGLTAIAVGLVVLVSFSYTVVRMDVGSIYARNEGIIYAMIVVLIFLVSTYLMDDTLKKYIILFSVFLISIVSGEGFLGIGANSPINLSAFYGATEDYIYVDDSSIDHLGDCIISSHTYETITESYSNLDSLDTDGSYLGVSNQFGLYYLYELKGDSIIEPYTIRGYEATKETVDLIKDQGTVVGSYVESDANYYFYHWLVTSGEYVWSEETQTFIPNDGSMTVEQVQANNKSISLAKDDFSLERTPASWGASMDSLEEIFTDVDVDLVIDSDDTTAQIEFSNLLNGSDADFLYLEFEDVSDNFTYTLFDTGSAYPQDVSAMRFIKHLMKKDYNYGYNVVLNWDDESGNSHSLNCKLSQGKLLLPLGSGRGWLLNEHSNLSISLLNENGERISVPQISTIRFLKLREVE